MQKYTAIEVAVGVFSVVGLTAVGLLSVSVGGWELLSPPSMAVSARFATVGELKTGAQVKMAGVNVGKVKRIQLEDYIALTELSLNAGLELPSDTIASIRTAGLLGESYVLLRPGGSLENLKAGDRILQTEPAIDLIDMVVNYALSQSDKPSPSESQPEKEAPKDEDDPIPDPF